MGPSVDQEDQWAVAEAGTDQVGNCGLEEARIPCSCHSLAGVVEAHIPFLRIRAQRQAALGSHVRRLGPESVNAAGIDSAAGLDSRIAAVAAGNMEAAALETGSDSQSVVSAGAAGRNQVAGDAS